MKIPPLLALGSWVCLCLLSVDQVNNFKEKAVVKLFSIINLLLFSSFPQLCSRSSRASGWHRRDDHWPRLHKNWDEKRRRAKTTWKFSVCKWILQTFHSTLNEMLPLLQQLRSGWELEKKIPWQNIFYGQILCLCFETTVFLVCRRYVMNHGLHQRERKRRENQSMLRQKLGLAIMITSAASCKRNGNENVQQWINKRKGKLASLD